MIYYSTHANSPAIELSIRPSVNHQLVPPHMRPVLASQGLDIDNFTPIAKQDMMARLD